jgi:hypothetical protein
VSALHEARGNGRAKGVRGRPTDEADEASAGAVAVGGAVGCPRRTISDAGTASHLSPVFDGHTGEVATERSDDC